MNGHQAKAARLKLGLSQTEFWWRIGVSQSCSSRYESGRDIPIPTRTLLLMAYGPRKQSEALYRGLRG